LCIAQYAPFAANTGDIRKGSLIFWKLGRPNLILELFRFHPDHKKLLLDNTLAGMMTGTLDLRAKAPPVRRFNQGKITGYGHNFASRTGD
jgi:hypothetical protein